MLRINVRSQAREAFLQLAADAQGMSKAVSRALNKTGVTVRAEAARLVRSESGLKVGEIKKRIVQKRATSAKLVTVIEARGGVTLPLMLFNARQTASGVTARIGKRSITVPHAFIKVGSSGIPGVFLRTLPGVARARKQGGGVLYQDAGKVYRRSRKLGLHAANGMDLPISQVRAEGIPEFFVREAVQSALKKTASNRFATVLRQEINFQKTRRGR